MTRRELLLTLGALPAADLLNSGPLYADVAASLPTRQLGKTGSADLIRYPLSLPGVACAIVGTGHIDREKPEQDQMVANLAAAVQDAPSELERRRIEQKAESRHGVRTNYFQDKARGIVQPSETRARRDGDRVVVEWNTALAGTNPIRSYEIRTGDRVLSKVPYQPQLTETPLSTWVHAAEVWPAGVTVVASELPPI